MQNGHEWQETIRRYQNELRRLQERSELPRTPQIPAPSQAPTDTMTERTAQATAQNAAFAPGDEAGTTPLENGERAPQNAEAEESAREEQAPAPHEENDTREDQSPTPRENKPTERAATEKSPPFGNSPNGTAQQPAADLPSNEAADETDTGTLVVRLNSARGTIPIPGATVTVYRTSGEGDRLLYIGETDESGESPTWQLATKDRDLSLTPGNPNPYVNYAVQVNADGYITIRNEGVSVFGGVKTIQRIDLLPLPEPSSAFEEALLETRAEDTPPELN